MIEQFLKANKKVFKSKSHSRRHITKSVKILFKYLSDTAAKWITHDTCRVLNTLNTIASKRHMTEAISRVFDYLIFYKTIIPCLTSRLNQDCEAVQAIISGRHTLAESKWSFLADKYKDLRSLKVSFYHALVMKYKIQKFNFNSPLKGKGESTSSYKTILNRCPSKTHSYKTLIKMIETNYMETRRWIASLQYGEMRVRSLKLLLRSLHENLRILEVTEVTEAQKEDSSVDTATSSASA